MTRSRWCSMRDRLRLSGSPPRLNKRPNILHFEDRVVPAVGAAANALALNDLEPTLSAAVQREWDVDPETQTNRWVVHLREVESLNSIAANGAALTPVAGLTNTFIAEWPAAQTISNQAELISGVASADWYYPLVPRQQDLRYIPNDPLFSSEWHLYNTGQGGGTTGVDIRATTAWNLTTSTGEPIRGDGVVVAIVDNGLQRTHPDLVDNYLASQSYDFNNNDSDPSPISTGYHGTAVAGVIGARGSNGIGVSGVAPNVSLAGLRLIAGPTDDALEAAALGYHQQDIDIYNSSWGPKDGIEWLKAPGPLTQTAIASGVQNGRGGLGNIYVWAAGNGRTSADNINYDGYANSRNVIAVGAIDNNGKQTWYSEPGAPMLVTAYSGGDTIQVTTTDLVGSNGKNGLSDLNYTNQFTGTSASSPIVSGVVALLLQANPNLSYRDVEHILVGSARKNDPTDADWVVNGAGHPVNHKYGFGAVDAESAVLLAKQWIPVGQELSLSRTFDVPQPISDNNANGVSTSVHFAEDIRVEHVEVELSATHASRGQLEVILTSPSGTQSVLAQSHGDSGADFSGWVFSSVRHWDESSVGTWTLTVRDRVTGVTGTLDHWSLRIYGTAPRGPAITNFETNEIVYLENGTAPLTSSLTIDLPASGLIGGATVIIAGGFQASEDQLLFTDQNGITGAFVDNKLTLSGLSLKSDYETALRSILYQNSSDNPSTVVRHLSIQIRDGVGIAGNAVFRDLQVVRVNDAPSFAIGSDVVRDEDAGQQVISGWATAISAGADEDTQTITFEVVSNSNPTLFTSGPTVTSDGTLTFETAANASGSSTIQLRLKDNGGTSAGGVDASDIQSFSITIEPVNDAPTTLADQFTITEDFPLTILPWTLLLNDHDVEDDSLAVVDMTQPTRGAMTSNADGSYTYTPDANFFGVDQFTYLATDGQAESGPTIVTISVLPVNDAPTANDDWVDIASARPIRIAVLNNDVDVDNDVIRVLAYSRPLKGRLTRDGDALSFLPVAGAVGADSFTYTVADVKGATSTATVHLNLIDSTPPKIIDVRIWNGTRFVSITGASRPVWPWSQVHRIRFVFSEDVSTDDNLLSLSGAITGSSILNSIYDSATHSLTASFNSLHPDRYRLRLDAAGVADASGNALATDWVRSFAILPGDFDGNGLVDNRDLIGIRRNFTAPGKRYAILADIDGNGIVNMLDYIGARQFLGKRI